MKGRYIPYSAKELAWLKANCTLVASEYARAFNAKFKRDVDPKNLHAVRKRNGWSTGRTGRFEKGIVPHNKDKPCPPGKGGRHPNARRTQFKPGTRSGVAVKLYKPIGTERLSKEGFLERKIHDGMPLQSRWRAVHLLRWEELHGAIPAHHCLKCLDGDRLNTDPSNWELISRATLAVLNRKHNGLDYQTAAPELRPAILAVAKIKTTAKAKRR